MSYANGSLRGMERKITGFFLKRMLYKLIKLHIKNKGSFFFFFFFLNDNVIFIHKYIKVENIVIEVQSFCDVVNDFYQKTFFQLKHYKKKDIFNFNINNIYIFCISRTYSPFCINF